MISMDREKILKKSIVMDCIFGLKTPFFRGVFFQILNFCFKISIIGLKKGPIGASGFFFWIISAFFKEI